MRRNQLTREIERNLNERRALSIGAGVAESCVGYVGLACATLGAAMAPQVRLGAWVYSGIAATAGAYILTDAISSVATGQRPAHLTQTLTEKILGFSANLKTSDIEQALRGKLETIPNYNRGELKSGVVQIGDSFYIDLMCFGVTEKTRVTEVREDGFVYEGNQGIGSHFFGLDDGGVLVKRDKKKGLMFYSELVRREI
jgi:hypothetical protein